MFTLIILWSFAIYEISCITVRMSDPALKVYDNGNISLTCYAEQSDHHPFNVSLSVRARMALSLLPIPRGAPLHQMGGVLHCDPLRTSCSSEFNFEVSCVTSRINLSQPLDSISLETACQIVDDLVCSHEWMRKHKNDCYALGVVAINRGPKLGERCVALINDSEQFLPCGAYQYCGANGICQCVEGAKRVTGDKCVNGHNHQSDSLNLLSSTTVLPPQQLPTQQATERPTLQKSGGKSSKALVIFLLIVAILLCIALAVVVVWSRSRRRTIVVGSD